VWLPNHAGHFRGQYRDHGSEPCATRKAGGRPFLNPGRYGLSAGAERRPGAASHSRHACSSCRADARPSHRSPHLQRRKSPCNPGRASSIRDSVARARHVCFCVNLSTAGRVSARASASTGGRLCASCAPPVIEQQWRLPPHRPLLLQNLRQVGKALQSTVESCASANPVKDEGVFLLWRFLPHRCARA
jgi:hypothetical protein